MSKFMNGWKRLIYSLVGVAAVYSLFAWVFTMAFWSMPFFQVLTTVLLVVGGLNWGVVAITGDQRKDLLRIVGL